MNAINPDSGDDWCNLTVDELQVELVRGLDKIADGLAVLQEGESHAEGRDGMTMTAEQASERMDALEKRVDRVFDVLRALAGSHRGTPRRGADRSPARAA